MPLCTSPIDHMVADISMRVKFVCKYDNLTTFITYLGEPNLDVLVLLLSQEYHDPEN